VSGTVQGSAGNVAKRWRSEDVEGVEGDRVVAVGEMSEWPQLSLLRA